MSGRPNPEGVTKIINLMEQRTKLANEASTLRQMVARLKDVEEAHAKATRDLWATMDAMDLTSSGNFGHEGRMLWFLDELRRQTLAEVSRYTGLTVAAPSKWSSHKEGE